MVFKTINETYIYNAIRKLKNEKAAGLDKIPATIIEDVGGSHYKTSENDF